MRSTLAAATVAALATTALGGVTSQAVAVPSGHRQGQSSQGTQHLRAGQLRVQREIEQREAALARIAGSRGLARLSAQDATVVRTSLATDRAALAALADQVPATTTAAELLDLATRVRAVQPDNYSLAMTELRRAARLQQRLLDARAATAEAASLLADLAAEGLDVAALSDGLEAVTRACDLATSAAATAADLARGLAATSDREDLHAVVAALASAGDALEVAEEQLEVVLTGLEAA